MAVIEYLIAHEVMPLCAVTTAGASEAMVTVPVDDVITVRTVELQLKNRNSDPALDHSPK